MIGVHVLVVDDEEAFRESLRQMLAREGFVVDLAADGEEALERFAASEPDIVLLDVMLPRMSGIDVCRQIRSTHDTPVIMVSARNEEIDAVVALEIGADDYIAKPYRVRELVARMRTVLRRSVKTRRGAQRLEVGALVLDRERHEVTLDGQQVRLPPKEFDLLAVLMERFDTVVSRAELIEQVWGRDYVGDTKTLDVHIKRLRTKVAPDDGRLQHIVTVRGVGYKLLGRG